MRWRKPILVIGKAGITVLLLWWLSRKLDFGIILGKLLTVSPAGVLLSIALTFCGAMLSIIRWNILTKQIGISIGGSTIIRYGLIGFFFNQALPSSLGGDGIRIWLLYQDRISASLAVRSILLDRLAGLLFLLVLSFYGLPRLLQQVFGLDPILLSGGLACGALLGIAVCAAVAKGAQRLNRYRAGRLLVEIVGDLKLLTRMNWVLVHVATLSVAAQLLACCVAWILIRQFDDSVSLVDVLIVMPVIFVLLVVPISIGGWGLREGLFVAGLGLIGVGQDVALISSIMFGLVNLVASLVGGVLWITDTITAKNHRHRSAEADEPAAMVG
jgi:uncharacterized membrane protein YbhN (UPF0104 family)